MRRVFISVLLFCILALLSLDCLAAPVGHPFDVRIVKENTSEKASGRKQLDITLIPAVDQQNVTQADILATAVVVAAQAQKNTKSDIVNVTMNCQKAVNPFGELQLAFVTYIPDGMGADGKHLGKIWELSATPRGFTAQELEYLSLWASLRENFMKDGKVDEDALEISIGTKMGIEPYTLIPHMNIRKKVEGTIEIEGSMQIVQ